LLTTYAEPVLVVTASVLGGKETEYPETHQAFITHIEHFDSNDYFFLLEYTEKEWMTPTVDFIILLIKLGNWDPTNCYIFFGRIRDELPHTTEETKAKLLDALHRLWDNYYFVDAGEASFVMNLGVLCCDLEKYEDALTFFHRAMAINREMPMLYDNIALAYEALGDAPLAAEYRQQSLELIKKKGIITTLKERGL
jgi:tetratricopeptide (TPR) repeat protein